MTKKALTFFLDAVVVDVGASFRCLPCLGPGRRQIVFAFVPIESGNHECHVAAEKRVPERELERWTAPFPLGLSVRFLLTASSASVVVKSKRSMRSPLFAHLLFPSSSSNFFPPNRTRNRCSHSCSPATCRAAGWTPR